MDRALSLSVEVLALRKTCAGSKNNRNLINWTCRAMSLKSPIASHASLHPVVSTLFRRLETSGVELYSGGERKGADMAKDKAARPEKSVRIPRPDSDRAKQGGQEPRPGVDPTKVDIPLTPPPKKK